MKCWRFRAACVSFALALTACQPGSFGDLAPVIGGTVEQGPGSDSAMVRDQGVSATVTARWASEASQSADVIYVNERPEPVSIALPRLKLRHQRLGDAPLWAASDMTGVDRDDARTDNDEPPALYDLDQSPATTRLVLKPGERRTLNVGFTNFGGEERIREGDRVTMTVPMGDRDVAIPFLAD